ncbi:MAG: fibronectin type III domain-containing protein, partial [Verrucomicrobiae bacterium]|nr:fibronectin type III domain-containing protein [Verrucomicrobiae bacterium]
MLGVQNQNLSVRVLVAGWILLIASARATFASSTVTLIWDPSPDSRVVGYAVWYGTTSGVYTVRLDVGNRTSATVSNLSIGKTYYFV